METENDLSRAMGLEEKKAEIILKEKSSVTDLCLLQQNQPK